MIIDPIDNGTVITAKPGDPDFAEILIRLRELQRQGFDKTGPLGENYSKKNYDLDQQTALSVYLQDGEPVYISSVWRRDFYPEGLVRILNRFWKRPDLRLPHGEKSFHPAILRMVEQQIEICTQAANVKCVFISREGQSLNFLQHMADSLRLQTKNNWHTPSEKFLVCPDAQSSTCWQHLIYTFCDAFYDVHSYEFPLQRELR